MTTAPYTPARGDVVWISFSPQVGREQAGRRPALVISTTRYNAKVGLAVVCPITNHAKGYTFEVEIPEGLAVSGVVLADQVKSLDWRGRNAEYLCSLPHLVVSDVLEKVIALLQV